MTSFTQISKGKWIILFSCASMFALGLSDNIRGPLLPELISFFQITNTQASYSFAVTSLFGFLGNYSSTWLLRFFSIAHLLVYSLLVMATGLLLMGVVGSYPLYLMSAACFGYGMGLVGIIQNLIVAENIEPEKRTKILSGLHGLYGLSSLIAPFVAAYASNYFGDWRSAFFITSLFAALVFSLSFLFNFSKYFEDGSHKKTSEAESKNTASLSTFVMIGGMLAFYVMTEILVSSRLALYMRQYFNKDLTDSSLYVSYFFVFLLIGRVFFAFVRFKTKIRNQLNILLVFTFLFLILGLHAHPFFLALTALTMAPVYPLSIVYISEQTLNLKRKFITFAIGLQNIGLISMHIGVGYLTDQFGLLNAFTSGFVFIILTLICLNMHPRVVHEVS